MSSPRLVSDLKKALAALSENESILQAAAHEFLIKIQSRNLRRRLQSLQQKDSSRPVTTVDLLQETSSSSSQHFLGSSWLACAYILVDRNATAYSEQELLFSAQTLLHRMRRVRIAEAVDVELEASSAAEVDGLMGSNQWSGLFQRFLPDAMLAEASANWSALLVQNAHHEELIKGIWVLITVGYATTSAVSSSSSRPLIETLLLALTTATFRLRYTTIFSSSPQACNPLPPMIQLLRQSLCTSNNPELFVMAIATMFDSVLGSPGGARCRMSCEPAAMLAAAHELRNGILPELHSILASTSPSVAAQACARIAPFATLPWECVTFCASDEALWLALYESASQPMEVMATNMTGVEVLNQKKKGKRKDVASLPDTDAERKARGEIACRATIHSATEQLWASHPSILAAASNACLPHCVRHGSSKDLDLIAKLSQAMQGVVCANPNGALRALSLEPLYTLHTTILDDPSRLQAIEGSSKLLVSHFTQCCFRLAEGCVYPTNYFTALVLPSDHDLEVERNDMRDLIRTIAGSGEGGSTSNTSSTLSHYPIGFSLDVLSEFLVACISAPLSEAVAHVFSSLAKPLNHLARCTRQRQESWNDGLVQRVFSMTFQFLKASNEQVLLMFDREASMEEILPMSRVTNIANASFSPFLAASLCIPKFQPNVAPTLDVIVRASIKSMVHLPELVAPSILEHSAYDIRGAMRAPGGDDHVGCVCLMRFTSDTEALKNSMTRAMAPHASALGQLYMMWKQVETERGRRVFHGRGVTPRTRRILLNTLCKADGLSTMLQELFQAAIASVSISVLDTQRVNEDGFYSLAESVFDLGAFSAAALASLFGSQDTAPVRCLQVMTEACIEGYRRFPIAHDAAVPEVSLSHLQRCPDSYAEQWNRLRGALFILIGNAHQYDLSDKAAEIVRACIVAECDACLQHLAKPVEASSPLFQELVIASDGVPAGVFIQIVGLAIQRCRVHHSQIQPPMNCLKVLDSCRQFVGNVLSFDMAEPSQFEDPRCSTAEAWFLAMSSVAETSIDCAERTTLLLDTTLIATSLLFTPPLKKSIAEGTKCMTLDGPQGLAILVFLVSLIRSGGAVLHVAADKLRENVPVDIASVTETDMLGTSILVAALFRSFQGGLPPWAVEQAPDLFRALFESLGCNPDLFGLVLLSAMELRASTAFGSVQSGALLSGPYFAPLQKETKHQFIRDVQVLGAENTPAAWRKVKVLIKRVCGGKKKNTDFNQKPALTRWNFTKL